MMPNSKNESTIEIKKNIKKNAVHNISLPWHGWLLGGIMCLYSLAAAYDYIMSFAGAENYYRASGMTEAQIKYFLKVPVWAIIGWTLSVWFGLFAVVALLFRSRFAAILFSISVTGSLIYILYVLVLSNGRAAMGDIWFMPMVLTAITVALIFYCLRLKKTGVLR